MEHTSNEPLEYRAKCLYPIRIINPRYKKMAREGMLRQLDDANVYPDYYIEIPCGKCPLCRKRYSSAWSIRLQHEFIFGNHNLQKSWFVTFTLAPKYYSYAVENQTEIIRTFLENYREKVRRKYGKKNGKSVYHYIVSERGEQLGRVHFHGLLFDVKLSQKDINDCWPYGFMSFKPLTLKRCAYVCKYITKGNSPKACKLSRDHEPRVFASAGLGRCYVDQFGKNHRNNKGFVPFIIKDRFVYALPSYYKNLLFSDAEKWEMSMNNALQHVPTFLHDVFYIKQASYTSYSSFQYGLEDMQRFYPDKRKKPIKIQFSNYSDFQS